jgi:hypothetical protein
MKYTPTEVRVLRSIEENRKRERERESKKRKKL